MPQFFKNGRKKPPPLAPLPVHLLPKALGGEGGEQHVLDDEVGNKKNVFSTFKKIKNKETLEIEAAKQEEDAQFLDGLFND